MARSICEEQQTTPDPGERHLELRELIDVPAQLGRFLPQFSIELFDLSGYNDEQLRGQAFMDALLLLLKYIFRKELPGELTRIFRLLAEISEQDRALECVRLLLSYVIQSCNKGSNADPVK